MKPPCCQVNRHWTPLLRLPLSLWPKSPITVNWVEEETTTWRVCGCGKALLRILQDYELPAVGRVKRGPSLSEKSVHHNGWLVRYDSLLLFHVAANSLSFAPYHISDTHGLSNLKITLDNLSLEDVASLRRFLNSVHFCTSQKEKNKDTKRKKIV